MHQSYLKQRRTRLFTHNRLFKNFSRHATSPSAIEVTTWTLLRANAYVCHRNVLLAKPGYKNSAIANALILALADWTSAGALRLASASAMNAKNGKTTRTQPTLCFLPFQCLCFTGRADHLPSLTYIMRHLPRHKPDKWDNYDGLFSYWPARQSALSIVESALHPDSATHNISCKLI